ncbi:flagellar basal-body MS-ring/collar protein FliF [Phreatobacter oligotrophus]|uniref:flagellar basal-body MS-ring/collar protein FliF n=1 Tax=Phreatobacter oligotrophus TaxID=1122261 RepID=UPI002357BC44|nr:flagellar basal-body MS-ring/collar protein FliF [Phreatobacter oligotrophus]MBX9991811.1 flagellar M-ring protein FliF [Phreatobacter oligotrophus]
MNGMLEFTKKLGAPRLAAMGAVALGLVGFFVYIILRMSQPQMSLLFSDLTLEDSSAIVKELERRQVRFQLRNDGAQVFVPQDQVARVRLQLAEGGMPRGGGVGYEIFDKGDALSSTSFVQGMNQLRALEGELARTIRGIERVQSARVHLVLLERALFSRERSEPSASIVLRVRGGLEPAQIRAIRHLVASAVRGLSPQRISIVDEGGRLLADGAGDASGMMGSTVDERKAGQERRLREQVESIIASVVGPGRARVQVTADMDFNRITQTLDDFDPERRVVRSTQTREEQSSSNEGREGQVTVGNELPGANQGGAGNNSREASRKTEETVNYEIARTQRTEVIEAGRVKRVSVAVLVDGIYARDAQGNVNYQPRSAEELDRIGALVRSAIGFDQRRGDQIEIVNLRFAEAPQLAAPEAPKPWWMVYDFTKDDIRYAIEMAVLLLVSLLVLLFVVRPLMRRIMAPEEERAAAIAAGASSAGGGAAGGASGAAGGNAEGEEGVTAGKLAAPPLVPGIENATMKMIEMAQIKGEVHQASLTKVSELVDKNPHETVAIIRQWLNDAEPKQ